MVIPLSTSETRHLRFPQRCLDPQTHLWGQRSCQRIQFICVVLQGDYCRKYAKSVWFIIKVIKLFKQKYSLVYKRSVNFLLLPHWTLNSTSKFNSKPSHSKLENKESTKLCHFTSRSSIISDDQNILDSSYFDFNSCIISDDSKWPCASSSWPGSDQVNGNLSLWSDSDSNILCSGRVCQHDHHRWN